MDGVYSRLFYRVIKWTLTYTYFQIGHKTSYLLQTGDLAGLGESDDHYFEVNYDSAAREFELITIWPYDDDTQLPGGKLVPRAGDTYILWNIRMPDEYYRLAEEEFAVAVDEYNRDHWLDIAAYKAPTDPVYIEEHGIDLFVGRRVKLESRKYFPEKGYRQSRITKISRKVNEPGQMDSRALYLLFLHSASGLSGRESGNWALASSFSIFTRICPRGLVALM